jgi:hypothetical protein
MHPYEDVFKAWMSVFVIGTNDDLYGVIVLGSEHADPWLTLLYSTLVLYILNFMTFGLVIAILLDGFSKYLIHDPEEIEQSYDPQHINTEVSEGVMELANEGVSLNTQSDRSESEEEQSPSLHEITDMASQNVIVHSRSQLQ